MKNPNFAFLHGIINHRLIIINVLLALVYLYVITFLFEPGNPVLFGLLIAGEVFHIFQIFGYCYTVWNTTYTPKFDHRFKKPVDIFITVAGEPVEIVRETVAAAKAMDYPEFKVHILNDGYVAKADNWKDIAKLGKSMGVNVITRKTPGGAKAGNINNGLRETTYPYFVVFDADHAPKPEFLRRTMGHFIDRRMGFVQTPQYYHNQAQNNITQIAWDQQSLFFGPIMSGKNRLGAAFMCGTNMAVSRAAVLQAGGMCEFNIAEDFLTSLFIHQKGWKSVYVPEVLAEGLAPEDFLSYYKQQFRWARGSLEVIFKFNPIFLRGLTVAQRLQYLISGSYYLSGTVVLLNALLPVIFLYTGIAAVHTSTMALAMIFIPYIFMNLAILKSTSNFAYTFKAIAFSISSFYLQIRAIMAVLLGQKTSFAVTSKTAISGNFVRFAIPHLLYIAVVIGGMVTALLREGISAAFIANTSWTVVTIACFVPFIRYSLPDNFSLRVSLGRLLSKPIFRKSVYDGQEVYES